MRVSVIVPHYDDLRRLDVCLSALGKQTFPKTDFEIIVADNGSPQGFQEVESIVAGRAQLISIAEKGAGPARNGGAAVAIGEVLAFLDSDCVPEPIVSVNPSGLTCWTTRPSSPRRSSAR